MHTTWIVAADASRARIFEIGEGADALQEIEDLVNPEGRLTDHELRSDAKGRYFGKGEHSQGHSAEPRVTPVQQEIGRFSRRVGTYLEKARSEHRFDHLWLIAPPKFLGLIRDNLGDEARKLVDEEIAKDLAGLSSHDIAEYVRQRRH